MDTRTAAAPTRCTPACFRRHARALARAGEARYDGFNLS
jgi:hypothetical protein